MLSVEKASQIVEAQPDLRVEGRDAATPIDARQLVRELKAYNKPQSRRSWVELAITLGPFLLLCTVMLVAVQGGHFVAFVLTLPAGLLLIRLFLTQHDCGHGSFSQSRFTNDWLGRALGVLTFTPYDCWRRSHALHHASTGNLDARGFGDVDTLTVREYRARTNFGKLSYRFYRHPLVMLVLGPAYLFLLRHRLPIGLMSAGAIFWVSAISTNVATAILLSALAYQFGWTIVLLTLLPVLLIAASTGVWLFYIQHQFESTHWDYRSDWSFHEAALLGSSYLELPPLMRWFTANIGIHHVHHLASRIPFYRLPEVLTAHPRLNSLHRFTALQTLSSLRLVLWDEDQRRLVSFRWATENHPGSSGRSALQFGPREAV